MTIVFLHLLYGFELPIKVTGAEARVSMTVNLRRTWGNRDHRLNVSRVLNEYGDE